MDVSSGDALATALPDLGFELGSLDWFGYMDLDLDEFWDGADVGSFLPVPAGKEVGLGLDLADSDGGGRESSPDSVVTDDGAPSSEPAGDSGDDGREMSGYVSELERFLMEDGDGDDESVGPTPTAAKEDRDLGTDEYFLGGYYVADDGCSDPSATAGVDDAGKIGAEDHYFIDDFYVADDGFAEPAAGAGVDDSLMLGAEEASAIAADDYFFDNDFYVADDGFGDAEPVGLEELAAGDEYLFDDGFSVADDGCAEPAAGVVDSASPDDDEEEDDGFAGGEDEATSRKRARYE